MNRLTSADSSTNTKKICNKILQNRKATTCYMSGVICHLSPVTCHLSHANSHSHIPSSCLLLHYSQKASLPKTHPKNCLNLNKKSCIWETLNFPPAADSKIIFFWGQQFFFFFLKKKHTFSFILSKCFS